MPYKQPTSTAPLLHSVLETEGNSSSFSERIPSLRKVILVDNTSIPQEAPDLVFSRTWKYETLIKSRLEHGLLPRLHSSNHDTATIQFTSGTTSTPKAACLTHRNVLNNAFLVGRGMCLTEQDIVCCPPPLYHCFGLVLGLLAAMCYGIYLCLTRKSKC